jgi:hypothetical protein
VWEITSTFLMPGDITHFNCKSSMGTNSNLGNPVDRLPEINHGITINISY